MNDVIYPAQPEKILKELGQVWTSLAKEESEKGKPTVLRACAMTLIVATDDEDEGGFAAAQTLTDLMHEHPSRAIVLKVSKEVEHGLEARVLAQCWMPFGKAQQICCETIEINANPERWPDVGPTVLGIIVADLPTVLWIRQKSALSLAATENQKAGLEAVMVHARKAILDTAGANIHDAFAVIEKWRGQDRIIADLEWTRITPWREAIAHVFDDPKMLAALPGFESIEIAYGGNHCPASAYYMAGWLAGAVPAKARFKAVDGFGPGLQQVTLQAGPATVELERTSNDCLTLRTGGRSQRYSLTEAALVSLMHEELTLLGPDDVFDNAFERAIALARD